MLRVFLISICSFMACDVPAQGTAAEWTAQGDISSSKGDYHSAAKEYAKAKETYRKRDDAHNYVTSSLLVLNSLLKSSDYLNFEKQFNELREYLFSATHHFRPSYLNDTLQSTITLFEVLYFRQSGNIDRAIDTLDVLYQQIVKANAVRRSEYLDKRIIQILMYLAEYNALKGNCDQASSYCAQSLAGIEVYLEDYQSDGSILNPYRELARCYNRSGELQQARETFGKMFQLLAKLDRKIGERSFPVYEDMFHFYLRNGQKDSAAVLLRTLKELDKYQQHRAEISMMEGEYFLSTDAVSAAQQAFLAAKNEISAYQGNQNQAIAATYLALGTVALRQQKLQDALAHFHNGLYTVSVGDITPQDHGTNPVLTDLYSLPLALSLLTKKAATLQKLRRPQLAWETARLATRFLLVLRTGYQAEQDKSILLDTEYPVFEQALSIAFDQFQASQEVRWIDSAALLMEESKALILRDALLHNSAKRYAGIPDSLLKRENTLAQEIADKEQAIREYRYSSGFDPSVELRAFNELANVKTEYHALLRKFETEHSAYYALRHKAVTISIDEIRRTLQHNQVMVEYFVGDSSVFILVVSQDQANLMHVQKDFSLETLVAAYRTSLIDFLAENDEAVFRSFIQVSVRLYDILFPAGIIEEYENLVVIPDGVLGYISFANLIRDEPETEMHDPRKLDYLLWHAHIAYAFSAGMYVSQQQPASGSIQRVSILAPAFTGSSELRALKYNVDEARDIERIVDGKLVTGTACTTDCFYQLIAQECPGILHLATHGSANDVSGDSSFLVFSDAHVYTRDLYLRHMPIELVYLSACETGSGELQRGEGIISLARAFFYAGVQSLVTTLWVVQDKRTATISSLFYKHLSKGKRKDVSLTQAQREYLGSLSPKEKHYAHPVYWSALIPMGNMEPLKLKNSFDKLWLLLLFPGVALAIFFWRKKK